MYVHRCNIEKQVQEQKQQSAPRAQAPEIVSGLDYDDVDDCEDASSNDDEDDDEARAFAKRYCRW